MNWKIEKETLFKPKKFDVPGDLILIPRFWDRDYFQNLKEQAHGSFEIIQCEFLFFEKYTVIEGFLGYPHILTVLEFLDKLKQKQVYFLGTAGSLNKEINQSIPLQVSQIYPAGVFNDFTETGYFDMKTFPSCNFRQSPGVSVDIIQRETPAWLKEQQNKGLDFVEMEIFPLRVYLDTPFHAMVVTSDLLKSDGIEVFPDKKQLKKEFVRAFEFITGAINEK